MRQTSLTRLVALASLSVTAAAVAGESVPKVYVIPLTGQMGTDIHPSIYEEIIKDAREVKPDWVVFRLNSADVDDNDHIANDDRQEFGLWQELEVYRDLMLDLKQKIDVPEDQQVMWIEDAVGVSTLLAVSWPQIYMSESARVMGIDTVQRFANGYSDEDVRAKMKAAWVSIAQGFPQSGGWPLALSQAMIEPQYRLGVKFDGRDPVWSNDLEGVFWKIDDSDQAVARFDADSAENVMLSQGTVEDLDDLLFLMGRREYEVIDSGAEIHQRYVDAWRGGLKRCEEWLKDIRDRGGNSPADLGFQRRTYEQILGVMRQYPAVETRMNMAYDLNAFKVEGRIEEIKEAFRRNSQSGRNSGRNRGGNGGGGLGG